MLRYRLSVPWLVGLRAVRLAGLAGSPAFRVLLFHHVASERFGEFGDLIEYLEARHGILAPKDAEAWLSRGPPDPVRGGRLPCLLTFDDGFASHHQLARSVLAGHGVRFWLAIKCSISATVMISSSRMAGVPVSSFRGTVSSLSKG